MGPLIFQRSFSQPLFVSLQRPLQTALYSLSRVTALPPHPFTPLTQRRCIGDSNDWWNHALKLVTNNMQSAFNDDNSTQVPLLQKFAPLIGKTSLELRSQNQIPLNHFNTLPQDSLTALRHLLIRNALFSSKDIACLINASPYLQTIDLEASPNLLTFQDFRSDFASKFTGGEKHYSLKRLRLAKVGVTTQDIITFFEFCLRLQELELNKISLKPNDLKNTNFAALPYDTRANLKELYIFNESILSNDIVHMLAHFPNLKRISLSGCAYVTTDHISIFRKHYPKVLFL